MKYVFAATALCSMLLLSFIIDASRIITGKVTDENGNPIAAATVIVKGTSTATVTNINGEYSIVVNKEKAVLVISYVGYESKEIKLGTPLQYNVTLKPSQSPLSEVVVVGYGTSTDKYTSYYAPSAKTKTLTGQLAGVQVQQNKNNGYYYSPNNKDSFNDYFNTPNNSEGYDKINENPFLRVKENPLSTFSIDVDAASYSNIRRFINNGQLPPIDAVRIEEMINYFSYQYPQPTDDKPFGITTEMATCPWNKKHALVMVGLQGKKVATENLPASNLVFLIDVSGSMNDANKLPLVQASLKMLSTQLRAEDKVAIVVYAGSAGLVLPSTTGDNVTAIKDAIDKLSAGGSTAGGAGIQLAYKVAKDNFVKEGNNRVILCTDGDFNVGLSSDDALEALIEQERKSGVFLTVLGFGMGNYQDSKMQKLADKGNGNHAYIDGINEAKKVLINEFGGTLFTIAKDVKLQIEFNPAQVKSYRLIGYENRMLAKEDFNNDQKDAGELGSGHTVTALYEIVPASNKEDDTETVDALRYQTTEKEKISTAFGKELMNIKLRYKKPDEDKSALIEHPVMEQYGNIENTSENCRFVTAVAGFGMLLRNSNFKGDAAYDMILSLARKSVGADEQGYRKEFVQMVENAALLSGKKVTVLTK
ncbi:vWA domain-containing protein [Limnovirga soli]|nr:VWA domain-containing protein [Limnovirga soli]